MTRVGQSRTPAGAERPRRNHSAIFKAAKVALDAIQGEKTRQAQLLGIGRNTVYYLPEPISRAEQRLMRRIDELRLNHPFAGSRMLRDMLNREGFALGHKMWAR